MSSPTRPPTPRWYWHAGLGAGDRQFVDVGDITTELGQTLPVRVAYESWGRLNARRDNAVLVEHALTGDSHVVGSASAAHPSAGWWEGLIGPGCPLDTDRYFVVASNVLGGCQGTTGPSSPGPHARPWGGDFPLITIRDQVQVEAALADALGETQWAAVLGGSMGGMRALEWAVTYPHRVRLAIVVASTYSSTADQIAWSAPQLAAITGDRHYRGGHFYDSEPPFAGMGVARRIAHTTYRGEHELGVRFGRDAQPGEDPLSAGGRYAIESYLDHHADKLSHRFDPNSYLVLTRAMNHHDIGRDRGGWQSALQRVTGELVVAGVTTDRLYPLHLSEEMAHAREGTAFEVIVSDHGHDGFLVERASVGALIRRALGPS